LRCSLEWLLPFGSLIATNSMAKLPHKLCPPGERRASGQDSNQCKPASHGLARLIVFFRKHLRAGIGRVIGNHRPGWRRRTLNLGASALPQGASARMRGPRLIAVLALVLMNVAGAEETKHLLVLYSNNRLLPANIAVDAGLREAI